jgi:hypothetical protein
MKISPPHLARQGLAFLKLSPERTGKIWGKSARSWQATIAQLGTPLAYFERGFCAFLDQTPLQTCPVFRAIGARDKRMPKPITDRAYS